MASEGLLKYIWDKQIMPQSGYGFSSLHSASYSLIALQNMNLAHRFPSVYWDTACLTVNSGANEDSDSDKSSEYGKIGIAIGDMQKRGVTVSLPDINNAGFSFTPDSESNTVIFGLKGIVGIGDQIVDTIIKHRPYTSFSDFLTRLFDTKLIQNQHILQLIKAGCFDSFGERKSIMKQYIQYTFNPRKQLTLASFNVLINLDIIPSELDLQVRFYRFRQHIFQNSVGKSSERKTKNRLFKLDDISTEFLLEHFSEECIVEYDDATGNPIIGEWLFDKEYEKEMQTVKDWLSKEKTLRLVNDMEFEETWNKTASGSISKWEMSSLSYYYHDHELAHLNTEKYGVVDFNTLPEEPIPVKEYQYAGQTRHEYELHRIAGTVLDKDKNRHTVTILTTSGVVTVKLYRNSYSYFDRQISQVDLKGKKTVLETSWFKRGQLILFTGFRRGNQFVPRIYKNSIYQNQIALINSIDKNGELSLATERVQI